MALQMNLEMDTGIILPEAYVRITDGVFSLDRGVAFITVQTYANKEARDNHKVAVKVHEVYCTMDGMKPQKDAKYTVNVNNAEVGSQMDFSLDIDGDGTIDIDLIEGTHITTDGTLGTYTRAIIGKLNTNPNFMYDFIASSDVEGVIIIMPLTTGKKMGGNGNSLVFSGNAISSTVLENGNDRIYGDFEKYFSIDVMNIAGNNVIKQAYDFIKTLPQYQNSKDV